MSFWGGFPGGSVGKNLPTMQGLLEMLIRSLGWEYLWSRKWESTPVFLPGKFHGQRSLTGYNRQSQKESATTEWLNVSFFCFEILFLVLDLQEFVRFLSLPLFLPPPRPLSLPLCLSSMAVSNIPDIPGGFCSISLGRRGREMQRTAPQPDHVNLGVWERKKPLLH